MQLFFVVVAVVVAVVVLVGLCTSLLLLFLLVASLKDIVYMMIAITKMAATARAKLTSTSASFGNNMSC